MAGKFVNVETNVSLIGSIGKLLNISIGGRQAALPPDAQLILDRFQQLLDGHQLNRAQLLRMVPEEWKWTLHDLSDVKALLKTLTPDKLKWLAERFGVREEWLAGSGDRIYAWPSGYKHPQDFVEVLNNGAWVDEELRLTVLSADYQAQRAGPLGNFVLVFSQPVASFDRGEHEVYRHVAFDTLMHWDHPPCRLNAKIMARWFHTRANPHAWIPIVRVTYAEVKAIADGRTFPGPFVPWGVGGFDQFQDRIQTQEEFGEAIETAECVAVIEAMERCGLGPKRANT